MFLILSHSNWIVYLLQGILRLSQLKIVLLLRKTCYYSPLAEVEVFSIEFKSNARETWCVILVSES